MAFINTLYNLWPNGDEKAPGLRDGIAKSAAGVFAKYGIGSNPLVIAHIMAQISHECGAGHDIVENLNYTASRMMQVWPSRFPTLNSAEPFAHNPQALANKVYNGRMGNKAGSNDGWNFRGRGGSQTTGREGYERVAKQTGLDVVNQPNLLTDPDHFLECAVSDFINCGCLPYAKADDVVNVTKRLNGGTIGLPDRIDWLKKWKAALGDKPVDFSLPAAMTLPPAAPSIPEPPPIVLPAPGTNPPPNLAPTFWQRFVAMFKPKGK